MKTTITEMVMVHTLLQVSHGHIDFLRDSSLLTSRSLVMGKVPLEFNQHHVDIYEL